MRRYHITLGSTTTAGGKVTSASSNGSINSKKIALEGDPIICPACKSSGKIMCVGPRIPEIWNGKKVALENDLCICGCSPPPKLKPSQSLRCQVIEGSTIPNAPQQTTGSGEEEQDILEQFFSIHDANNDAVEGFRYDMFVKDTVHVAGVGLQDGNTVAIIGDNQKLSLVTWPSVEEVDLYD